MGPVYGPLRRLHETGLRGGHQRPQYIRVHKDFQAAGDRPGGLCITRQEGDCFRATLSRALEAFVRATRAIIEVYLFLAKLVSELTGLLNPNPSEIGHFLWMILVVYLEAMEFSIRDHGSFILVQISFWVERDNNMCIMS